MPQVQWRALRVGDTFESNLIDVRAKKSLKRFATSATLTIEDTDGTSKADYPRGQRVELEYSTDSGGSYTRWMAGAVVEARERDQQGADVVEVELVGYDFFLRREEVFDSYSSTLISDIIQDLITTYTPVNYVGGNVTVANDNTIDANFEGERVDSILSELATDSAGEDYGVNDDFEFFFEPREVTQSPSDVGNTEWIDYDLPDKGTRSVNQVRLFYGSGGSEASIIVEDAAAQTELKNKLNAPRDVVISESKTFPEISTEDEARRKANEILNEKSEIITGTVTTFGKFDMEPGQVFNLKINDQNLDDDFRIADIEHRWRDDTNTLTVAENDEDLTDEFLTELSDDVSRIDARDADPTAPVTRDLSLTSGVELDVTATITQYQFDTDAFILGYDNNQLGYNSGYVLGWNVDDAQTVNDSSTTAVANNAMLNLLRDVWGGDATTELTHVGLGTGSGTLNRTNNSLATESERISLSEVANGNTQIDYEVQFGGAGARVGNDITELGVFDAAGGGNMFMRALINSLTISSRTDNRLRLSMDIDNDDARTGVITNTGQSTLQDLVLGTDTDGPLNMLYGTGTTAADVTDTSLGTQVFSDTIDSFVDRSVGIEDVKHRIESGEANGNDISELGEENTNGDLLSRIVFSGISKTNQITLNTTHSFQAVNQS